MTPREKWREETVLFLSQGKEDTDYGLMEDQALINILNARVQYNNYLLIEYLNVKTSDDEKNI